MKLLCSILIFAGIFALNDASLTSDEEMRLVRDQMMLEELRQSTANRDSSSIQCSQDLLAKLTAILNVYTDAVAVCNETKSNTIESLYKDAAIKLKKYGETLATECSSLTDCLSLDAPVDGLDCFETETSQSAKVLSSVSNEAATDKLELLTGIETAVGNEDVCKTQCYGEYAVASDKAQTEFNECTKKPSGGGGSGGSGKKTTTTEAPEAPEDPAEASTPSDEEQQEDVEGKPSYRANKFRRF